MRGQNAASKKYRMKFYAFSILEIYIKNFISEKNKKKTKTMGRW